MRWKVVHEILVSCYGEFLIEGSSLGILCWFWSSAQLGVEADSASGLRWHLMNEPCISALVLEITAVCLYVAVLWTVTVKEADIQFTEGLHKNKYRKCFVCMQFYFELVFICRFIIDYYCVMRNNVLMMMRKTIFDVLKRNFADFKTWALY